MSRPEDARFNEAEWGVAKPRLTESDSNASRIAATAAALSEVRVSASCSGENRQWRNWVLPS